MTVDGGGTITRGFLFADLRGYTDFVEQRGAAAAAELLTRYRALAREEIARFGGAEIKTEGDSFYVVFDSVSSAVRCGLAITTAAKATEEEPIRVGIGVHAGETIEADGGYVGSPVNIAARICSQAAAGEVLVSETVRALTMTLLPVHFRSRGRRQLKGVAEPIELLAVEQAPEGATAWPSSSRRRLSRRARIALAGGVAIVAVAALGGSWLALRTSTGLPAGPWTIGVHMPLSGPGASEGIAVRNAVRLAIDQSNEAGRFPGVELSLKAYDSGGYEGKDPARGAAAARKMTSDPRTIAAVGPFTSPVAGSTIPITNRAGLLECSPSTSYGGLTKPERGALELRAAHPKRINFVRLSPTDDNLTRGLAGFAAHDLDAESALVIADPDWSEDARAFDEEFTALGGQVAHKTLKGGTSPAAVLEPFRATETSPDVVVFAGNTPDGAPEIRLAMRAAGLGSTPFVSWDGIFDGSGAKPHSYLQRTGKSAAGTYVGQSSIAPPRVDFVDAYRAAFREEPTPYASAAYACTQVILASLEAVAEDGPRSKDLREAVRAYAADPAHRYETVLGTTWSTTCARDSADA
jgi:branched-chain amino acid transport system substrate-binding protein